MVEADEATAKAAIYGLNRTGTQPSELEEAVPEGNQAAVLLAARRASLTAQETHRVVDRSVRAATAWPDNCVSCGANSSRFPIFPPGDRW